MSKSAPVTVIETPEFQVVAQKLISSEELTLLIDYLAYNPSAGDIIPGTGGVRKLRWALEGRGKRGGARVIYFFHNTDMPLFVLTAYAKNERTDLTQADRNDFKLLTSILVEAHTKRSKK